jgi:hypothetical protein
VRLPQRQSIDNPQTAIDFVFAQRRNTQRLAYILLWQAVKHDILPLPVETLDHDHRLAIIVMDVRPGVL